MQDLRTYEHWQMAVIFKEYIVILCLTKILRMSRESKKVKGSWWFGSKFSTENSGIMQYLELIFKITMSEFILKILSFYVTILSLNSIIQLTTYFCVEKLNDVWKKFYLS
jgi:hypothetical protein